MRTGIHPLLFISKPGATLLDPEPLMAQLGTPYDRDCSSAYSPPGYADIVAANQAD